MRFSLRAHGSEVRAIPVDQHGLVTSALAESGPFRGVFVTPSHQFPTGALMPVARRLELLDLAEQHDAFVFEDDYDSEYRYEGRPVESLQGLDRGHRVFYSGSTSKLMFPALRIGWIVVPESCVTVFRQAKALCDTGSPVLDQLSLADFIDGGHLERHLRRSRIRNAKRREAFVRAVERHLGDTAHLDGTHAGLHGLMWLNEIPVEREAEVRRLCAQRGVGLYPALPFFESPPERAGFIVGFSALTDQMIDEGIGRVADVVASMSSV